MTLEEKKSRGQETVGNSPDFCSFEPTIQDFLELSDSDVAERPAPHLSWEPATALDYANHSSACAATVAQAFGFDVAYFLAAQRQCRNTDQCPTTQPDFIYDLLATYGPINVEKIELPEAIGYTALQKGNMECYKVDEAGTQAMYCYALAVPNCPLESEVIDWETHGKFTIFAGFQILTSEIAQHSPLQKQSRRDILRLIERSGANLQRMRATACSPISV